MESLKILKGEGNESQIDAICINASIFLLLADKVSSLEQGFKVAKNIIHTNKVWTNFLKVVDLYGGDSKKLEKMVDEYKRNM